MAERHAQIACALGATILAGCGAGRPAEPTVSTTDTPRLVALESLDPQTPLVRAGRQGLEAHWWVVNDADLTVARTLNPWELHEDKLDPPLADQVRAWRNNGFRIARVPIGNYDTLREAMPPSRTFQRIWLGEAPQWRELIRGRTAGGSRRLLIDGRLTQLPAGKLRTLARAWVYPTGDGPRLRVALVPHVDLPDPGRMRFMYEQIESPASVRQTADGILLDTLELAASMTADEMLVITADKPSTDWSRTPPPRAEQLEALGADGPGEQAGTGDDGLIPWDPGASRPEQGAGPPSSRAMTIGEAMLCSPPDEVVAGSPKVVIVLLPRLPDRFTILGLGQGTGIPNPAGPTP